MAVVSRFSTGHSCQCEHTCDDSGWTECFSTVQDASKAQRSEEGDMDTSPAAIVKRVAVVVSVLVFAGVVLFLLALKFSFPELI